MNLSAASLQQRLQNGDRTKVAKAADGDKSRPTEKFVWGAGIECSFIPHLNVDQFEWTQHTRVWKDDFRRAREVAGLTHLRYALPWHQLEPERGRFDWAIADERIQFCRELGIELYLDVMHFGVPTWLKQAAGDPEFPEALEAFTAALVGRYAGSVDTWCPCNEPLVLALFSGDLGFWPPHSRRWRGYMPVLSRIMQAVSRSIRAIRRVQPEATILLCDNVEHYRTTDPQLQEEVTRRNLRRFLALDLLLGRVDSHHPLHQWVTDYGMSELDLDWFRTHPQSPDVIGMDYYPNSEWRLEQSGSNIRQRRAESGAGVYGISSAYYARYGLPLMVTETSTDGKPINREIWLEQTIEDCRRLRAEGIPLLGYFWWPLFDQVDWDGALTHRVGKIHEVGLYSLRRQTTGELDRIVTPLISQFARVAAAGNEWVGELESIAFPVDLEQQGPPVGTERISRNGNGHVPASGAAPAATRELQVVSGTNGAAHEVTSSPKKSARFGIVVFSHLRWGFVWQRPQQFLSRFARKHRILFVEEPFFDLAADTDPRFELHHVMPHVTVLAPHFPPGWQQDTRLPEARRKMTHEAMALLNDESGDFDLPLLWYYSPMDAAWSLGHFQACGVVYDCMDELSQFTGAPPTLLQQEARLIRHSDVVFAGGYELGEKKREQHHNVHTFGCGVECEHFERARDAQTQVPPDLDFMNRPILGWFGVVDERVDYTMVGEMARMKPDWSFAMIGPVVKVDPNLLPHAPNLFWMGGRDYQLLPQYVRGFDVCMMPFAMNRSTQFINPTKALEYMASGKPIVGTPVRDVVRQWSNIVRVAGTASEFIAAAEQALQAGPDDPRLAAGISLAEQSSWDATVARLQTLIGESLSKRKNGERIIIEPLSEAELQHAYISTQGS